MYNINKKYTQTMLHHKENVLVEIGLLLLSHHYFAIHVILIFSGKKSVIEAQQIYIVENELGSKMNIS